MNEEYEYIEPNEQDFFLNKKTDKIYVSKSFNITQLNPKEGFTEQLRPIRYVSRVVECEQNQFVKIKNEISLRTTANARQEIVAKIFDDTRGVITLQIQKFSTETGNPHKAYFTWVHFKLSPKSHNFVPNKKKYHYDKRRIFGNGRKPL